MTPEQRRDFEELLDMMECDARDQVTRAICVIGRILLTMTPDPLPSIPLNRDQE